MAISKYKEMMDDDDVALGVKAGDSPPLKAAHEGGHWARKVRWTLGTGCVALSAFVFLCSSLALLMRFLGESGTYHDAVIDPESGRLAFERIFPAAAAPYLAGDDERFAFLVVGDWGRDGTHHQAKVAQGMANVAAELRPNFVVSTGDNFYDGGLASTEDPQFDTSFVEIYANASLQVPWLAVLGNHDYGDSGGCGKPDYLEDDSCLPAAKQRSRSPLHQLDPFLREERDWRWVCGRSFNFAPRSDVQIFFIDTSPFIEEYKSMHWADIPGGLSTQSPEDQRSRLERWMETSEAGLKIVVGHHPFHSNSKTTSTPDGEAELRRAFGDLFRRQVVALYFNGHDHDLQHIESEGTHFFTSGGGSRTRSGFGTDDTLFEYDKPGFASVVVAGGRVEVALRDENGRVLHMHVHDM